MSFSVAASAQGLTRKFGETQALAGLDFDVPAGEVFGVLGHNGAGKTTMIRLLNGLITPTTGTCQVLGMNPVTHGTEIRARTGVLTETPALDSRLTGRENLSYYADFFEIDPAKARRRIDFLIDVLDLTERERDRVGTYSRGMHQRLALARAMLNEPDVLFLDEPTSGLDPVAIRAVHLMINAFRSDGGTVILCTHNLEEAEQLCDRVIVLERGRIIASGITRELMSRVAPQHVELEIGHDSGASALAVVGQTFPEAKATISDNLLQIENITREQIPLIIDALADAGVSMYRITPGTISLADVYFSLHDNGGKP